MTNPNPQQPPSQPAWEPSPGEAPPINLEACYSTGDGCFFPYAYLGYCHFDSGGVIELHFASRILRVTGRNLRKLYEALVKHAVSVVRESDAAERAAETEASVEKIEVVDADD